MERKVILGLIFGMLCILPLLLRSNTTAFATDPTFSVSVAPANNEQLDCIRAEMGASYITNHSRYAFMAVTLDVHNNPGFGYSGFKFTYNGQKFKPICDSLGYLVYQEGEVIENLNPPTTAVGQSDPIVVVATQMNNTLAEDDGHIITFFLISKVAMNWTPNTSVVTSIMIDSFDEIYSHRYNPYTGTVPLYTYYTNSENPSATMQLMIGDLNGDGDVDATDAQALLNVLNYNNTTYIVVETATEAQFTGSTPPCNGMVYTRNGYHYFMAEVADVNQDGIIDATDAQLILDYYIANLAQNPTDDYIGSMHSVYIVSTLTVV